MPLRFISLNFEGSSPPLGAILRPGGGYQLGENVGDLSQFFAAAKAVGLEGLVRCFGNRVVAGTCPLVRTCVRGFGCWVGRYPLQELMPSVISGWGLEVTQIPSKMPVLDPPAYSELGAAELLGSFGEGKLSEPSGLGVIYAGSF